MTPSPPRHMMRSTWLEGPNTVMDSRMAAVTWPSATASRISKSTDGSTSTRDPSLITSTITSRAWPSRFVPSFFRTKTERGASCQLISSCCVEGWLSRNTPSTTACRLHECPSLRTRYTPTWQPGRLSARSLSASECIVSVEPSTYVWSPTGAWLFCFCSSRLMPPADALELGVWAELEPDELEASALAAVRALAIQSEAARMLVYCLSASSFFSTSLLMAFLFVSSLFVSLWSGNLLGTTTSASSLLSKRNSGFGFDATGSHVRRRKIETLCLTNPVLQGVLPVFPPEGWCSRPWARGTECDGTT
mmetsp:Transcript_27790/g.46499  ORF Transcript_27790/g.46499 Transcript_27790/m.46499 type:complete len:306 (+) Transcript_27790:1300-2217(+)